MLLMLTLHMPLLSRRAASAAIVDTAAACVCMPHVCSAQVEEVDEIAALESRVSQQPAAAIVRVAELCDFQEQTLRRAAAVSDEERFAAAVSDRGLPVGPADMVRSVEFLLRNTKLQGLPGCAPAAVTISGVKKVAERSTSQRLSARELLHMANQFAIARRQLDAALAALPEEDRRQGRMLASQLKAAEEKRRRNDETESARLAENPARVRAIAVSAEEDSVARRRKLGQRTSVNELNSQGIAKALYGK